MVVCSGSNIFPYSTRLYITQENCALFGHFCFSGVNKRTRLVRSPAKHNKKRRQIIESLLKVDNRVERMRDSFPSRGFPRREKAKCRNAAPCRNPTQNIYLFISPPPKYYILYGLGLCCVYICQCMRMNRRNTK